MIKNLKKGDPVEFTISDLAFGGAGVGKISQGSDGREYVIFVEGTVPGDRVRVRLTKIKTQYGEARLDAMLEPSSLRISPRCRHFASGECGGCSLQFFGYEQQLAWKQKIVEDSLRKLGGFEAAPVGPIIGCKAPWHYRNKMEYSFSPQNSLPPQETMEPSPPSEAAVLLGLHRKKSFRDVFDVKECFLESPLSVKIVHAVREWARELMLTAYDVRTGAGVLKNLVVREGKNTGEVLVNLITNGEDFPKEKSFIELVHKEFPEVTSLYRSAVIVRRGHRTVTREFHCAGKPRLTDSLCVGTHTLAFEIFPQAFFQPNTKQAEILYGKVLEFACMERKYATREDETRPYGRMVLDLFCGTGTIGMFLAKAGTACVLGIDNNASAIENARANAAQNGLQNIEFLCADVLASLSNHAFFDRLKMTDLLITDPPRAGIAPAALQKILELKIPRWIYVSCNPTTLARDLKTACAAGYKLQKVQPIDMFPQTYHVETISLLERLE